MKALIAWILAIVLRRKKFILCDTPLQSERRAIKEMLFKRYWSLITRKYPILIDGLLVEPIKTTDGQRLLLVTKPGYEGRDAITVRRLIAAGRCFVAAQHVFKRSIAKRTESTIPAMFDCEGR